MPELPELIAAAVRVLGSEADLARALDETPQHVNDWRHLRRACPPDQFAVMASLTGLDPLQALAHASIRRLAGTSRGMRLAIVLGMPVSASA